MIGEHNVVLAYLPGMGVVSAAAVAGSIQVSFPNIKLALVFGICGGMPYGPDQEEIVLGDVIISQALLQSLLDRRCTQAIQRFSKLPCRKMPKLSNNYQPECEECVHLSTGITVHWRAESVSCFFFPFCATPPFSARCWLLLLVSILPIYLRYGAHSRSISAPADW